MMPWVVLGIKFAQLVGVSSRRDLVRFWMRQMFVFLRRADQTFVKPWQMEASKSIAFIDSFASPRQQILRGCGNLEQNKKTTKEGVRNRRNNPPEEIGFSVPGRFLQFPSSLPFSSLSQLVLKAESIASISLRSIFWERIAMVRWNIRQELVLAMIATNNRCF